MTGLAVLLCAAVAAAAAPAPYVFELETGKHVWSVASEDVNGDGLKDIVAFCCEGGDRPQDKALLVFLATKEGAFKSKPSFSVSVDPKAGCAFFAETDGAAPREILAAHGEGATLYRFEQGRWLRRDEPEFHSLFPTFAREPRILKNAVDDLDGDGVDEWFIPVPTGYEIRGPAGVCARVPCDMVGSMYNRGTLTVTTKMPAHYAFDMEGSPAKALAFLSDEHADFAYGNGWTKYKRFAVPGNLGEKWDSSAAMEDLNADGLPDLIVTQIQGTINMQVVTKVYHATGPMTYSEDPSGSFETKGSFSAPIVEDVDGDGKSDLVFITIPWGVRFFMNLFIFQKLGVGLEIFLHHDDGYGAKPDFESSISIDAPDGREQSAHVLGDFNGDGRADIAFGSGPDLMNVHTGSKDRFISSKPWCSFAVPAFGIAFKERLNDNDADDIVLFHPGMEKRETIHVVVF
ncbi:MAG: VCBS repeat-containing protein [bacterium]|nr:VCBS repeat-containing protein [bacterium]